MDLFDLTGKTAIVTGGNGGIGLGIAEGLAGAGANIMIAGRNGEKNAGAAASLEAIGAKVAAMRCDVTRQEDIDSCVSGTIEAFGGVDILVNNAGVASGGVPQQLTDETWDLVLDVNLKSVLKFCQACYPHMKDAGGGKIINIGSMYSLFGSPFGVPYSASKGGVVQLTKSLAVAWARQNIQVNVILPGWITTDMTAPVADNKEFYDLIIARTPSARFGDPEELAGAGVFLASKASDFVTGISLPVDGGFAIT